MFLYTLYRVAHSNFMNGLKKLAKFFMRLNELKLSIHTGRIRYIISESIHLLIIYANNRLAAVIFTLFNNKFIKYL